MPHYPIGPAYMAIGDPTTASGADMNVLNEVEEVNLSPGIQNSFATTALTAGAPVEEGVYSLPPNTTISSRLNDVHIDQLELIVLGGTKMTDAGPPEKTAFGFGGTIEALTLPTLAVIPAFQAADKEAAVDGIWIPAAFSEDLGGILYNRMQPNASSNNAANVTWRAARRLTDQDDTAIPPDFRFAFKGDPGGAGLSWSLPTLAA